MLKKEVRILGLSATARKKNSPLVVGVVFRGSSWLDGLLTCSLEPSRRDDISRISRAIMKSRQYSQLRAVILAREQIVTGRNIDITDLARRLKLPVIAIIRKSRAAMKGGKAVKANRYDLIIGDKRLSVSASGISHETAQEIFTVACAPGCPIPEAARVSDLIAEQVTLKWNSQRLA